MTVPKLDEEAIFNTARKIAAGHRAEYLRQVCDDDALRDRILALLQVHDDSQGFLRAPALDVTVDATTALEGTGARIGPYKLLQPLGEGGMGTVWMAEQSEPVKRLVALKVVKAGMDSAQVITRFEAERQALALMDHPNIAKVLGAGTTDSGRPYFVMELVKGIAVTKYCDERRLSPRDRLALFIPVCHAVQHAHQKGIIHRDLKPSNVMIALYDGKPVPKVIDFGVAKATGQKLTEKTMYTGFGAIVGTLEYMSPEQAELNQLDIDTRSDIYSLGVLLYELLTGSTPLDSKRTKEGALLETLRMIREDEPLKPSARLSSSDSLPTLSAQRQTEPAKLSRLMRGELDWMVMKALEKDRERRYETANEMAQDIERYLNDEPVQAGPPSPTYRLRKFVKRNKAAVLGAAVVLLTLLAGIVGTSWGLVEAREQSRAAGEQRDHAAREKNEADKQRTAAVQARNEAVKEGQRAEEATKQKAAELARVEGLLYDLQFRDAYARLQNFDLGRCRAILDECRPDLRGPEYRYLVKQLENKVRTLHGAKDPVSRRDGRLIDPAFSGDSKRMVLPAADHSIKMWDLETGKGPVTLSGPRGPSTTLALNGDGTRLFLGSEDGTIQVWDLETNKAIRTLRGHKEQIDYLMPCGDGKRLVSQSRKNNTTFNLWDLETGKAIRTLHEHNLAYLILSGDGNRMAFATIDKVSLSIIVKVWDLDGKEILSMPVHKDINTMDLSPDGKRLVSGSHDSLIRVWDLETGKEPRILRGHGMEVESVLFSKDGKQLYSGGGDHAIKVWDLATGKETLTLRGHTNRVRFLALSGDGRRLVSGGDGTIKVWDPDAGRELNTMRDDKLWANRLSSDGKRLISFRFDASQGYIVKVYNLEPVQEARALPRTLGRIISVAQSADGKRLFFGTGLDVKAVPGGRQFFPADGAVNVMDLETGKVISTLLGLTGDVRCLALSRDGKRLFGGSAYNLATPASADDSIKAWDLETGKEILTLRGHRGWVLNLIPTSDAKRLISSSGDGIIKVWDLETQQAVYTLRSQATGDIHTGQYLPIALSADGTRLFSGNAKKISVWDLTTGKELYALHGHTGDVRSLALAKNSKHLYSGSDAGNGDRTIKVWDLETRKEIRTLKSNDVDSLVLSGDGKRLFSGGSTITIWDLDTSRELLELPSPPYGVAKMQLSADASQLVAVGREGTVQIWEFGMPRVK